MLKLKVGLIALLIGCAVFISCDEFVQLLSSSDTDIPTEQAASEPGMSGDDATMPPEEPPAEEAIKEIPDDDEMPPEEPPGDNPASIENTADDAPEGE